MLHLRCFIVLWLCFYLPGLGVSQMARLEVLSSDQGLSQGMIYDILQDRTGFLWFGTRDGLNRYNGYSFEVFKNDPFNPFSISDNIIKVLFEDHLGRIWVGTETNGVDVIDPATRKIFHLNKGENGLPSQNINAFAETPDGAIWIGTQNGLSRVLLPAIIPAQNPDLNKVAVSAHFFWEEEDGAPIRANIFMSLLATGDGMLWVGTARNAYRFDPATGQKVVLQVYDPVQERVNLLYNYFIKGPDGSPWLGQYSRILHFKENKTVVYPLPPSKNIYGSTPAFDTDGNLFVGRRKEIYFFSKDNLSAYEKDPDGKSPPVAQLFCSFPEKDVIGSSKILCDRRGLVWIGTNGYGIRKYNPVNRLFRHYLSGVSTRKIRPNANGELWVWTSKGGFSLLDERADSIVKPILGDDALFQHDCLFARDGSLWVLAQKRNGPDGRSILIRKNLQTGAQEQFENIVFAAIYSQIMEDRKGNIWLIGQKSDLVKFDPERKTHQVFDLSAFTGFKEYGFSLLEDANGHIWVGTPHGLVRCVPGENEADLNISLYKNNPGDVNSLNNNAVLAVCDDARDPAHFLWVGTRGGGLNRMNKTTGECRHYTPADGLPNDVVYGILGDSNGHLWLSTNYGLSKFNPESEHFENYSAADGLQDNEFNTTSFARKQNGELVFGGVNGLTVFDPKVINPDNSPPPVLITALKIQDKTAVAGDGILDRIIEETRSVTLPYDQNDITLEFAALDFSTPLKNQFRYRLMGADDKWSAATTDHSTTFSNLQPGKYTFEVLTGGAHGIWNDTPARLDITVLAPWWKSKLALLFYFLLLMWVAWEVYRVQVRRIQLQEQLAFEHRESERIRALEQMKTNFFSNITHELRTPVTLILEPLRQILNNPGAENWLSKVRLAEGNSRKLLQIVNQLLDLAKLESGAMHPVYRRGQVADLLGSVADSFTEQARNKSIAFHCAPAGGPLEPFDFDADKLGKIATNLLSNAMKFTPKGGEVEMSWCATPDGWFLLEVRDSGPGIAPEDLPRVFDRFYSKGNTPEQEQNSTGIGLALCRELAELMGGRMEADNREGSGAVFRLWLPMLLLEKQENDRAQTMPEQKPMEFLTEAALPPELQTAASAPSPASRERPLLLLAEDNQELRHFISQTLSKEFEVIEAVDGQDAVELARERIPDIIVSDLMMPRLDGLGLLDVLKKDVRTSHIPTLLLTAKMALESRIEGLQHGADAYLGKPFQTEELFAWLNNLLAGRRRLQEMFARIGVDHGAMAMPSDQPSAGPSAPEITLGLLDRQFLNRVREIAEQEIDNDRITPEEIARRMAMSRSQLHRKLSAITGLSATEYLRNYRLDRAFELLQAGAGNVSEVAWRVGFVNAKHFSTSFKERFGKSPSEV